MSLGRCFLLCALGALGVSACRGAPPPLPPVPASSGLVVVKSGEAPAMRDSETLVDRVVAIVNDDVILMSELQEAVIVYQSETKGAPEGEDLEDLQQKILKRMVDLRLQVQEARREKIEVTEDDVKAVVDDFVRRNGGDRAKIDVQLRAQGVTWEGLRRDFRDHLLMQRIRSRRVGRRATVTEAEVDAYMAENRPKLEAGLKYHARHIVVLAEPPDQAAAWERAKTEVDAVAARLRDGTDFAALARERSKDPSAAAGDDLGWLARGEMDAVFEGPLLKLAKGGVTEPIRSGAGYHLFRLEDREELTPQMLAESREQAR